MKKYLMTLLTLGLACNAAACMEDEPFYDTEIPPHASIDNSKGEGVTRLVTYNVGIFNKYIKDDTVTLTVEKEGTDIPDGQLGLRIRCGHALRRRRIRRGRDNPQEGRE